MSFKRVFNFAFEDFYRNKGLSVAAIFVLVITTLLVTGIFFMNGISNFLVDTIQNKIDVTAYFKADTQEQDILDIKDEILAMSPEIKSVEYVSKEKALENFKERHKDSDVLSEALTEVGENPFLPSLNIITTGKAEEYEQVSNVLGREEYTPFIEKVDFLQKKDTIEKIFAITSAITLAGVILGMVLIFIAVLVVLNTIRLVIDRSREEINTMKMVGASRWFIKAPFIIQGAIFGVVSFLTCFIATLIIVYFISPSLSVILPGFNMFDYFAGNLWLIILIQLGFGTLLGVISSFIVVRKYLKF